MEKKDAHSLVLSYIEGLKEAYIKNGQEEEWKEAETAIHPASEEDIQKLKEIYPEAPDSLIELLKQVDGTYDSEKGLDGVSHWTKSHIYFLGSDVEDGEYPYYLLSAKRIVANKNKAYECYADFVNREYDEDDVEMDERIIDDAERMNWLHFSNCMNNGGSSRLFIDFSPSEEGIKGQILRYLDDLDGIIVIADSFDEYLQMLIDNKYAFIH